MQLKKIFLIFVLIQVNLVYAKNKIDIGPYLQLPGANSVVIKWMSSKKSPSIVELLDGKQSQLITDFVLKKKHEIVIRNLKENHIYNYKIYSKKKEDLLLLKNKANTKTFSFKTLEKNPTEVNIAIFGDPGIEGDLDIRKKVRNSQYKAKAGFSKYLKANKNNNLDFLVMLGDNAYPKGTKDNYIRGFFEPYEDLLSKFATYLVLGNHDAGYNVDNLSYSARSYPNPHGVYYKLFTLPDNEVFYSVDQGDVHLIFLDSYDSFWEDYDGTNFEKAWTQQSSKSNKMLTWLEKDLKQNTKKWTVVFFHQPPLTQKSKDEKKDVKIWKPWIRAYLSPVFEKYNVDLIVCGHIHNYQRSFPLRLERQEQALNSDLMQKAVDDPKKIKNYKYAKLLQEANIPKYKFVQAATNKNIYFKNDYPLYVIMGNSGAAFKKISDIEDSRFVIREQSLGTAFLNATSKKLEFKMVGENAQVFDSFKILDEKK